jgi:multidrug resistance efflux pump
MDLPLAEQKLGQARLREQEAEEAHAQAEQLLESGAITRSEAKPTADALSKARSSAELLASELELAWVQLGAVVDSDIAQAGSRIRELEGDLATWDARRAAAGVAGRGGDESGGVLEESVLVAPLSGLVTLMYEKEEEVVRMGDPVLKIADLRDVFIKAQFPGVDEGAVSTGAVATIEFENGDATRGRIRRVYPDTEPLRVEYKRTYGPHERFITAEVVPLGDDNWSRILQTKADVVLRKRAPFRSRWRRMNTSLRSFWKRLRT